MPELNISNAVVGETATIFDEYEISSMHTDGVTAQKETTWQNSRFGIQWGYFNQVPDLKQAILLKGIWVVGKGYTCNPLTSIRLRDIRGWGKDSFDDILFNMEVMKRVSGDSYAEIIWNDKEERDFVINLKVLDPASIKIVVDSKGIIKRYEQTDKTTKEPIKFDPRDIFHLSHNRLADQIHGISDIDVIESTITAQEKNFVNAQRQTDLDSRPFLLFKLKTDNQAKIAVVQNKINDALNKGTYMVIPDDENILSYEVVKITPGTSVFDFETLAKNRFFRSVGLPQVLAGTSSGSEAGTKMEYFSNEQIWEKDQRFLEKQLRNQLRIELNLIPPATMQQDLQGDEAKDGAAHMLNMQPNDTTAGVGR